MGAYVFAINPEKNRLYITLSGFFREEEASELFAALQVKLSELKPGFDVVTDLREFKPGSPGAARELRRGAESIKARGRRRAVRVAGRLVVGVMQFRRELSDVFDESTTQYASSVEEADRILDQWSAEADSDAT